MIDKLWTRLVLGALVLAGLVAGAAFIYHRVYQTGWDAHAALVQAQVDQEIQSRMQTLLANVADAKKRDEQTIADLERSYTQQTALAQRLDARLKAQGQIIYRNQESNSDPTTVQKPLLGQSVLDDDTVRMLNAARTGCTSEPNPCRTAGRSNEEGTAVTVTAPAVSGAEFAANDLAIVRLYHELATRHDALVDWVTDQLTAKP